MNTYLNPYSLQGFAEAASGTVVTKQGTDLVFQSSGSVQSDYTQMDSTAPDYIKNAPIVRVYRDVTGVSYTTSPSYHAKWDVTDSSITSYTDGMVVCLKVPNANPSSYGTGFQINSLGYHAIVYDKNTAIGNSRYSAGSVVWAVYNSTQKATLIINGTSTNVTGCWQIMDYSDTNSDNIGNDIRARIVRPVSGTTYQYRILFSGEDDCDWVPSNTTNSNSNTTNKTVNQTPINPFGEIIVYTGSTTVSANNNLSYTNSIWSQYQIALGFSFNKNTNNTAPSFIQGTTVYIKCLPQTGGGAIIDATNPYVTSLPSTNDGFIYIMLGVCFTNNTDGIVITTNHPVYYHDGNRLRLWTGSSGNGVNLIDLT